jgi:hypothetical protein
MTESFTGNKSTRFKRLATGVDGRGPTPTKSIDSPVLRSIRAGSDALLASYSHAVATADSLAGG